VNAFSEQFWKLYGQVFDQVNEGAEDIRAIVLSSSLPKIFTAGIELSEVGLMIPGAPDPARRALDIRRFLLDFQRSIGAPERCRCPVIVAVHGPVIGLGIDLISYCDIRYAASDATFCIKEVDAGLAADIGTLAFLPKITGNHSLVRELSYTARPFSASEAEKLGLVSKVVEGGRDAVTRSALELAAIIASKSPLAVAGTKHLITHARDHPVAENLAYTALWNAAGLQTKDTGEGVASIKAKRPPTFSKL